MFDVEGSVGRPQYNPGLHNFFKDSNLHVLHTIQHASLQKMPVRSSLSL